MLRRALLSSILLAGCAHAGAPVVRAVTLPEPVAPAFPEPGEGALLAARAAESAFRAYDDAMLDWTLASRGWRRAQIESRQVPLDDTPEGDDTHLLLAVDERCGSPEHYGEDAEGNVFRFTLVPHCAETKTVDVEGSWPADGCGTRPPRRAWFAKVKPGARLLDPVTLGVEKRRCLVIRPSEGFSHPP